jgi:hypothetical protein
MRNIFPRKWAWNGSGDGGKQDWMQADGGGLEHCNSNSNAHENSKMAHARLKMKTVEKM